MIAASTSASRSLLRAVTSQAAVRPAPAAAIATPSSTVLLSRRNYAKVRRHDESASSTASKPATSNPSSNSAASPSSPEPQQPREHAQPPPGEEIPSATPISPAESEHPSRPHSASAFDIDTTLATIAESAGGGGEGTGGSGSSGGRTGARARSAASQSSAEQSRKNLRRLMFLAGCLGGGIWIGNTARPFERDEIKRFSGEPGADSALGRLQLRLKAMWTDLNAPVWEKLLPDVLPFPYSRPYTLVVDLDDLLVHSNWTRENGWRTAKRPGLDYFLGYLSQMYEIVIFTTQPYYVAGPIIEKLDPDRRYIQYTLFRESCRTHEGKVVKDLSHLNRDLSKVVVLDTDPERYSMQPENGVRINKWDGSRGDVDLIQTLAFLEAMALYRLQDVRPVIKRFEGKYIPLEWSKEDKKRRDEERAKWEASKSSPSSKVSSWFSSSSSSPSSSPSSSSGPPKSYYDVEKERYQQAYLEDLKFWQENGEALRNQAKAEQEKQMKEMKLNAWSMITGQGMPSPGGGGASGAEQK